MLTTFTDSCWVCWWIINIHIFFHTRHSSYSTMHKRPYTVACIYTVIHTLAAEKTLAERRLNLQCEVKNGQVFLAVLLICCSPTTATLLPLSPALPSVVTFLPVSWSALQHISLIHCTFIIDSLRLLFHAKRTHNIHTSIWH